VLRPVQEGFFSGSAAPFLIGFDEAIAQDLFERPRIAIEPRLSPSIVLCHDLIVLAVADSCPIWREVF
jgi:hypothetical protein